MQIYTPTNFRKNLYGLLAKIVDKNTELEVTIKQSDGPNKGVVLLSKERYDELAELNFLQKSGTLDVVMHRMENEKPDDFNLDDAY